MSPSPNYSVFGMVTLLASNLLLQAAPPSAPTGLRVNDVDDPVGIGAKPYFGWLVQDPDNDEQQTAYQILVASSPSKLAANEGDVWDSGKVSSGQQNHVLYGGPALAADTEYFWKVRTWDKDGAVGAWPGEADIVFKGLQWDRGQWIAARPAGACFVVGLPDNADWAPAKWIRRDTDVADDYTYFRKTVALSAKPIERATVYISSANKYALYMNGQLVGKGPAYHYPQFQYYNAYDITPLVRAGSPNLFAIFNHWFGSGQGRPRNGRGVILKAVIHHTDGSQTVVATDGTWKQSAATAWVTGQPRRGGEGVGHIERIDARNLLPDWNSLFFDDSAWTGATVVGAQPVSPWTGSLNPDLTRIVETERVPASVAKLADGKYVVDLGRVYSGIPRIWFSGGQAGETVSMMGGYGLKENGEIDPSQNQNTDMRFFTVLDGGTFAFEPAEYYGMRYFQIDNAPMPVTTVNFRFIERHSAMNREASSFNSPNATLNAVWDLMKHSLFVCAQEAFVDTPTREKGGFLGDASIQSAVAMPVLNERPLTQRSLNEFLQSMEQFWSSPDNRGRINAVYPNGDGARDIPDYTQAYLFWVWEYFMETGDRQFLEANYDRFKDVADYVHRHTDSSTGLITNLTGGSGPYIYGIVDWPAGMRYGYDFTEARTVINGWGYMDYDVVSRIAEVLGKTGDRDEYRKRANALQSAINEHLLSGDGIYIDGLKADGTPSTHVSQHANMFPLALGIVPEANLATVTEQVKESKMSVGMVTVLWLVRAIGEADQGAHLIELFTNEKWDGWANNLAQGATATWESWTALQDGESQSHAWGSAGLYGYVRYVLGITPLKPQYELVQIKPLDFGDALSAANGRIATDRGEISVDWKRKKDQYTLSVTLPDNMVANVLVPKGDSPSTKVSVNGREVNAADTGSYLEIKGVGSGTHSFERPPSPGIFGGP